MRFSALDGWRGLFAIFVVLGHFPAFLVLENGPTVVAGSVMVDMFFILSGFVIMVGYEERFAQGYDVRRFLLGRLGRIYPIHLALLLAFVLTEVVLAFVTEHMSINQRVPFTGDRSIWAIFTNLALIQSFNIHDTLTWNFPAWSLSTEWAAYLLFALAMLVRPGKTLPFAVFGAVFAAGVLYVATPRPMQATYDFGVFRSIYGFALGVIGYYIFRCIENRNLQTKVGRSTFTALEIVTVFLTFALPAITGPTRWQLFIPPFYMCAILLFAFQGGVVSSLLSTRFMVYLGTISLSIYVCHIFFMFRLVNVFEVLQKWTGMTFIEIIHFDGGSAKFLSLHPLVLYPLAVAFVAFIIVFSHFTRQFIEIPGGRWFRSLANRFPAQQVVDESQVQPVGGLTK
ncbi:acyltransferase [Rhizobium sp. L1K21]|uniref:acyltransferase family protein n=1 Tax=Rhizobium sp. L1K21 TaxID=2954933 RepID=UPI002092E5C8|nr:acyltransferase [Rhizobium sp. L1K21]MCO6185732.1 acyltransferase [Rhizobium sp. L1K21]